MTALVSIDGEGVDLESATLLITLIELAPTLAARSSAWRPAPSRSRCGEFVTRAAARPGKAPDCLLFPEDVAYSPGVGAQAHQSCCSGVALVRGPAAKARCRLRAASVFLFVLACRGADPADLPRPALRLVTTYTLEESGIFSELSRAFSAQTGRPLAPVFVGSGDALERGKAGQADVVWCHSRASEDAFVSEGYGINRRDVMYSEFVLVGPRSDPAEIAGSDSAVAALAQLSRVHAAFISRGDQSGTHVRELSLWKQANLTPDPAWYTSLHAGMLDTLEEASKRHAYALSDLPTFLTHEQGLALSVLVRGDSRLHNPYGVIAVNPDRFPESDYEGAMAFIDFVTSEAGQTLIADYGRERFGTPLFHPLAETGGID